MPRRVEILIYEPVGSVSPKGSKVRNRQFDSADARTLIAAERGADRFHEIRCRHDWTVSRRPCLTARSPLRSPTKGVNPGVGKLLPRIIIGVLSDPRPPEPLPIVSHLSAPQRSNAARRVDARMQSCAPQNCVIVLLGRELQNGGDVRRFKAVPGNSTHAIAPGHH